MPILTGSGSMSGAGKRASTTTDETHAPSSAAVAVRVDRQTVRKTARIRWIHSPAARPAVVKNTITESRGQKDWPGDDCSRARRSEEHTSELQSRENLVWRLLA